MLINVNWTILSHEFATFNSVYIFILQGSSLAYIPTIIKVFHDQLFSACSCEQNYEFVCLSFDWSGTIIYTYRYDLIKE